MTHEEIQILISAYADGEVTPSEKNIVEEHLSTCPRCQKDYKIYMAMSSSLSKWSDEALSPDEEMKVQKRFEQRREPMFTKRTAMIFVTTLCLTIIVGNVSQLYMKRGVQGQLKTAADDMGDQYAQGNARVRAGTQSTQYERNYLASNYPASAAGEFEKKYLEGRLMGTNSKIYLAREIGVQSAALGGMNNAPTVIGEGSTANYYQNTDAYYGAQEDRKKIQQANISLLVDNAFNTKLKLTALVLQFNGIIMDSEFNRSADGAGQGTMVCKVYPNDMEAALQQFRKLGEVEEENEGSRDVTDQYADAQKNVAHYTSEKDRLQKALNDFKLFNPTTDEEKENIKSQIEQTEEEIKALQRVIKFYEDQTSMSTIVVNFHDNLKNIIKESDSDNTWKAAFEDKWKTTLQASWEVFSNILFGVIYIFSFIVPVLIWCAIFGIIYFIISRFFKK